MHIPTHILSGWVVGNVLPLGARERLLCMVAASVADVDGLGRLVKEEWYWEYHHVLGHNLLFTTTVAMVLAAVSSRGKRVIGFFAYFGLGHLHLLLDYLGSGPGWPICYWWPFRRGRGHEGCWINHDAWAFDGWQNKVAGVGMVVAAVVIGVVARRTPLEALMPQLDRKLVGKPAQDPV